MVLGNVGQRVVAVVRCEQAVEEKGAAAAPGIDNVDEWDERRLGDSVDEADCTINDEP